MRFPSLSSSVLLAALVGCGGVTAEHPLNVKLGVSRDQAVASFKSHKYCPKQGEPPAKYETYPRCDRPGTEWGESWVTARYEGEKLVEVRRYERFTDDARAIERWNQLIADRSKISKESPEATQALRSRLLEPGTRSVKAFRADADTIVGVYLLTPSPPEEASVLEALLLVPSESAKLGELDDAWLEAFEMPTKRAFDAKVRRAFADSPTSTLEDHLRVIEPSSAPAERPVGDFPSACGYGPCERGGTEPFGFQN